MNVSTLANVATTNRGSRDAMIDATIESIHLHGLPQTTVTTACDLAGLSRGMVRRLFETKAQMLASTMDRLRIDWTEASSHIRSEDPEADLVALMRSMFAANVFTPARVSAWIALSAEASTNLLLRPIREQAQTEWTEQLAAPLRRARVEPAAEIADALLATADGLWLRHSFDPEAIPRERAERVAVLSVQAFFH